VLLYCSSSSSSSGKQDIILQHIAEADAVVVVAEAVEAAVADAKAGEAAAELIKTLQPTALYSRKKLETAILFCFIFP